MPSAPTRRHWLAGVSALVALAAAIPMLRDRAEPLATSRNVVVVKGAVAPSTPPVVAVSPGADASLAQAFEAPLPLVSPPPEQEELPADLASIEGDPARTAPPTAANEGIGEDAVAASAQSGTAVP